MIHYSSIEFSYKFGIPENAKIFLDIDYLSFRKIIDALQRQDVFSLFFYSSYDAGLELEMSVYEMNAFLAWLSVNEEKDLDKLEIQADHKTPPSEQEETCKTIFRLLQLGEKAQAA